MMHITFAATTAALLAGKKTVTRRDWKESHAAKFKAGDLVAAYDKSPRVGGKQVAVIRITKAPYLESTGDTTPDDWHAEGFDYMTRHGMMVELPGKTITPYDLWTEWMLDERPMWVVRFELVEVLG